MTFPSLSLLSFLHKKYCKLRAFDDVETETGNDGPDHTTVSPGYDELRIINGSL